MKSREFDDVKLYYMGLKSWSADFSQNNLENREDYQETLEIQIKGRTVNVTQENGSYLVSKIHKLFFLKIPTLKRFKSLDKLEEKLSKMID